MTTIRDICTARGYSLRELVDEFKREYQGKDYHFDTVLSDEELDHLEWQHPVFRGPEHFEFTGAKLLLLSDNVTPDGMGTRLGDLIERGSLFKGPAWRGTDRTDYLTPAHLAVVFGTLLRDVRLHMRKDAVPYMTVEAPRSSGTGRYEVQAFVPVVEVQEFISTFDDAVIGVIGARVERKMAAAKARGHIALGRRERELARGCVKLARDESLPTERRLECALSALGILYLEGAEGLYAVGEE